MAYIKPRRVRGIVNLLETIQITNARKNIGVQIKLNRVKSTIISFKEFSSKNFYDWRAFLSVRGVGCKFLFSRLPKWPSICPEMIIIRICKRESFSFTIYGLFGAKISAFDQKIHRFDQKMYNLAYIWRNCLFLLYAS